MHFGDVEGRVLHGLIENAMDEIVVRLDKFGFITYASANSRELGIDLEALLLMPHISDFADPDYSAEIVGHLTSVLDGEMACASIEFPLRQREVVEDDDDAQPPRMRRWYAISLQAIELEDGIAQGALGLIRSVQHKHVLGASAPVDPYTGLPGRTAFCARLSRAIADDVPHCMAIFAVDRMQAILVQYGQATTDEIRWGFARFLETMTCPEQEVAHLDNERFGVILPEMNIGAARSFATEVLQTFADLTATSSGRSQELSASAGLARVEGSVDWTLRQAELGLVMARAGGGSQIGQCKPALPHAKVFANGESVERAMEAAIMRAEQRHH